MRPLIDPVPLPSEGESPEDRAKRAIADVLAELSDAAVSRVIRFFAERYDVTEDER